MCILFVDDELLIREVATEFLIEAGFEVVTAMNGKHALEQIDLFPNRFGCLVTDYHMPHVDGGKLIDRFRLVYLDAPVILASAYPHATSSDWRRNKGVELLLKPYSMPNLVHVVTKALNQGTP